MYQSLPNFLEAPFSRKEPLKDSTYKSKYAEYIRNNKIRIVNTCIIDKSWYVHLKVQSESNNNIKYDVVIRFFENSNIMNESTVKDYKVQFFSNSPSFIYNYAYLYKKHGYLIESLYNKMQKEFLDIPPKKENVVISYDKSIYFCVLYLSHNNFVRLRVSYLNKFKTSESNFLKSIDSVELKNAERELTNIEKRLNKTNDILKARQKNSRPSGKIGKLVPFQKHITKKTANKKITANKKKTANSKKGTMRKR